MKAVVRLARADAPLAGYWHPGEIDWWFSYGPDHRPFTTLWFDGDGPAGWVVINEPARAADSAVRTDLRGGPVEEAVIAQAEQRLGPGAVTHFAAAAAEDGPRRALLAAHGYERTTAFLQVFAISSDSAAPDVPALPPAVPAARRGDRRVGGRTGGVPPPRLRSLGHDAGALHRLPAGPRLRPRARRRRRHRRRPCGRVRHGLGRRSEWDGTARARRHPAPLLAARSGSRGLPGGGRGGSPGGASGRSGSTPTPPTRDRSPSTTPAGSCAPRRSTAGSARADAGRRRPAFGAQIRSSA